MGKAVAIDPSNPAALSNLSAALLASGRAAEALVQSQRAVEISADFADGHYNLGTALAELGRPEEALAAYRRALEIQPEHAVAENNLGNVLRKLHWLDEAIEAYRRAIRLQSGYADAHNNLGVALAEKGTAGEAVASYRRALQLKPDSGAIHNNLGNALQCMGQYAEATIAYQHALKLDPHRLDICHSLGNALLNQGRLDEAIDAFRQIIRRSPDDPQGWIELGNVFTRRGKIGDALSSYGRALQLNPDDPYSHCRVGSLLQMQGRPDEAAAAYTRALDLFPNQTEARYRLAEIFKEQGKSAEALSAMRRVLELAPDVPRAHSDLILLLLINPDLPESAVAAECGRWNERFGAPMTQYALPYLNNRNSERRLRIGYVSPDFHDHVVGRNLLPLFREHDRARCEIICYSGFTGSDRVTEEFRRRADRWYEAWSMNDEALADQIRQDEVDILVDLTLHAAGNRLPMFAHRPAPVQVSFAGYPGSTGLEAIKFRISDGYLESKIGDGRGKIDRESEFQIPHSEFRPEEQSFLIDSFWCYDPCGVELDVTKSPVKEKGFVTFASLNDFSKVNDPMLRLWARVLNGVKDSRLMLLTYRGEHRQRTVGVLKAAGIEADRIGFFEPRPRAEYLALYQQADVMLDPFPYNGHTTSLDALWMGVPVVSLAGERIVSRAGLSQLSNLGLPELVAFTEDDYVDIATRLARDLPRLIELRASLRARMEASVLMDAPRFARQIEDAYRAMWRQWCTEHPV
jgi:predicted O-linked N-acetylglucosamine transferase (SPINDLY family)